MSSDEETTPPRLTDSANADAVVASEGDHFLYVLEWESWIAWDGRRWARLGAKGLLIQAALTVIRREHAATAQAIGELEEEIRVVLLAGAKDEEKEAHHKRLLRLLKWLEHSQNAAKLDACVRLLESRRPCSVRDLDADPWLLNVANGTLDLRTAELHPHDPANRMTQMCDVPWSDSASAPTWDAFVREVMGADSALAMYLQRLVGYAITGLTTEHILAFFHGDGRNGKSTFVQTINVLLGDYACAAPRDLLFEDRKGGERHPAELARLYGVRVAICAEIGQHVTLDEAKVKDLTGGDAIGVRRMREDFWDLIPTHTLFVAGNHKPTVRGDDLGIWRRIRLIPWLVTIEEANVDRDLPAKLRAELPGILRWAVQGCLEWQRIGLQEPACVREATETYRAESDVLGDFLAEHVVFEADGRVARDRLREKYHEWCEKQGCRPLPPIQFARRLKKLGIDGVSVKDMGKVKNGWRGCRLKSDYELVPPS